MYADNTLLPKESLRLCALGELALAEAPMAYGVLAGAVRNFTSRLMGPSLDMMGSSLELMTLEGLIEEVGSDSETGDVTLALTAAGREKLRALLLANLRDTSGELNRLILALKMRFLHLLDAAEREEQIALMLDACETELGRLIDLRATPTAGNGPLAAWLDFEIDQLEAKLNWLETLPARCTRHSA